MIGAAAVAPRPPSRWTLLLTDRAPPLRLRADGPQARGHPIATAAALHFQGYSIYSARLPVPVLPPLSGADSADQGVYRLAGAAGDGAPDTLGPQHGEILE
jgi:hypothetical protein